MRVQIHRSDISKGLQKEKIYETCLPIHEHFLQFFIHFKSSLSTTSRELRQQFAAFVDEDDNCKIMFQRVGHAMMVLTPARMPTTTANPIGIDAMNTFLLLASVDPAITRHSCKEMSISHRIPWSTDTPSVREMGDMLLRPASFINL